MGICWKQKKNKKIEKIYTITDFQALRIFVESVLRYGLPVNFRAAVIIPGKNQKKLRDRLNQVHKKSALWIAQCFYVKIKNLDIWIIG